MEGSLLTAASTPVSGRSGKRSLISCISCRQRKIKCDKGQPNCSSCARSRANCVYVAKALPLRKKRTSLEEELMGRLKTYEILLKAHGIQTNDVDRISTPMGTSSQSEASKTPSVTERVSSLDHQNGNEHNTFKPSAKFVTDAEKETFIESPSWNVLDQELQGTIDMLRVSQFNGRSSHQSFDDASPEDNLNAGDFLLNGAATHSTSELKKLHPKPLVIFRLWQIFLDDFNPLSKILHGPTTQQRLLDAIANLDDISKEWEALMFAIYLSAIRSMSADECQIMMGESKAVLTRRYQSAVRSALLRANFTSSLDILLIQAFAIYLYSVRLFHGHDTNSLWILTGTAIRLGQRLGLHRDGTLLGLSPFETEIRRRVWWRLLALDGQTAEHCGAGQSIIFPRYDCKRPLNVNDSDLSPNMSALPSEHDGPTEMIFCGFRYEIELFMRNAKADGKWMGTGGMAADEKMNQLNELQALIERKYLRFCDPSVPLHLFTKLMGEAAMITFRMMVLYSGNYPQCLIEMPPKERDKVFWNSMHALRVYNQSQRTESVRRYLCNFNLYFHWHAFIILAHELQIRSEDEHTQDAWSRIEELFEYNADVIVNTNTPLHKAVSKLMLGAWSVRQTRLRRSNTQLPTPEIIATLLAQAGKQNAADQYSVSYVLSEPTASESTPASQNIIAESTSGTTDRLETLTPNSLADGMLVDWSEWDSMLQDFELQNASFAQI